jgi:hypothetical protein
LVSLAGAVGEQRAHARGPEFTASSRSRPPLGTDLADDQAAGPHPLRFLDQVAEPDLAGAHQADLPDRHGLAGLSPAGAPCEAVAELSSRSQLVSHR